MQIPGYQIEREIGHGGMATVYQAVQTSLERAVALKVMAPALAADATFSERFQKEAKTAASLTHPNILAIHDIGAVGPYNYIAMELVSGGDLKQRIRERISTEQSLQVIKQVAAALDHAHRQGFVHRDIKPENILFRGDGTAVLTDFGIAKSLDTTTQMTATGLSIGTPRYMSPEQAQGKSRLDSRSDLYSLGVVLFETLSGKAPYDAETPVGIALQHVQAAIPELPPPLSRYQPLIDRLMAKKPADRYATGSELIDHIERIEAGKKLPRGTAPTRRSFETNVSRLKWLALALALILIAGAGSYFFQQKPRAPAAPAFDEKQRFSVPAASGTKTTKTETHRDRAPSLPQKQVAAPRPQKAGMPATDGQQQKIQQLLASADRDLAAMRLAAPKGNNAAEKYHRVLELDPGNAAARRGLDKLIGKYLKLCNEAVSSLSFDKAEAYLDRAALFNWKPDQIAIARRRVETARRRYAAKARPTKQSALRSQAKSMPAATPKHGDRYSNGLGMNFIYVGPGRFMMGSPPTEPGRSSKETPHKVVLTKGFWLQTTEVTQAQWVQIMGANPSHFKGIARPVESVSWRDIRQFIEKLNRRQGRDITVRLPTEAEWEYAARAGTTTPFAFGRCLTTRQANYIGKSPLAGCKKSKYIKQTVAAGTLAANGWGFYDMHGNVHEWCQDWLGAYPSKRVTDPAGPRKGRYKIIRGGSWRKGAAACRSAARNRYSPTRRSSSLGFRLAAD
jgi:serine/threonine protein kinase/formylglycine-generating enzyme required for sulfatase activity